MDSILFTVQHHGELPPHQLAQNCCFHPSREKTHTPTSACGWERSAAPLWWMAYKRAEAMQLLHRSGGQSPCRLYKSIMTNALPSTKVYICGRVYEGGSIVNETPCSPASISCRAAGHDSFPDWKSVLWSCAIRTFFFFFYIEMSTCR